DGTWPPLPNARSTELVRDARTPVASGSVQVALAGQSGTGRTVVVQAAHRDLMGRLVYARPREVVIPNQPGPILPAGDLARVIRASRGKSIALLGSLLDPSRDCRLDKDESSFRIRIEVPGKLHTLSPELGARPGSRPLHNAPMTLTEVEGDFAAAVEI